MMTITAENIKEIIRHGEHSTLEMKKCKKSVPDSVWETYSAFANTQARNSTIRKMLRMIGFGDNIGSGFMKIIKALDILGFDSPEIHEEPEVNEVWLTFLCFPEERELRAQKRARRA